VNATLARGSIFTSNGENTDFHRYLAEKKPKAKEIAGRASQFATKSASNRSVFEPAYQKNSSDQFRFERTWFATESGASNAAAKRTPPGKTEKPSLRVSAVVFNNR